jgi:Flp pilus assembly pilin Flp
MLNFFVPYLSGLVARMREEAGQGLAEYALILAFIALVAIGAVTFLGSDISSLLSDVATSL